MTIIDLTYSDEEIPDAVRTSSIIKYDLLALNSYGKGRVRTFIKEVRDRYGAETFLDDLFFCGGAFLQYS